MSFSCHGATKKSFYDTVWPQLMLPGSHKYHIKPTGNVWVNWDTNGVKKNLIAYSHSFTTKYPYHVHFVSWKNIRCIVSTTPLTQIPPLTHYSTPGLGKNTITLRRGVLPTGPKPAQISISVQKKLLSAPHWCVF